MITKINHIGIAVNSIEEAVKLYTDVLGLKVKNIEVVEEQRVRTAIIPVGETKIELLESTDPEGPIAKHFSTRGEGMHHLALEVNNVQDALEKVAKKGVRLIDERPRKGVENTKIGFLHPKGTKVLLELVESEH
jgi:methylmalonyl-CoA epimerase